MFRVTDVPIDLARLVRTVADPRAGAVVTFLGTTRSENGGGRGGRLWSAGVPGTGRPRGPGGRSRLRGRVGCRARGGGGGGGPKAPRGGAAGRRPAARAAGRAPAGGGRPRPLPARRGGHLAGRRRHGRPRVRAGRRG